MNMDKIIAALSTLPVPERQQGLKLISKIIENILDQPNQPKYRSLDIMQLSKKFKNTEIWFDVLLHAGFCKSSDNCKLKIILDKNQLLQLDSIHNALIEYEQVLKSINIQCFCGNKLREVNGSNLYDNSGVHCDICGEDDIYSLVWHCDNISIHPDEYDICNNCKNTCTGFIQGCYHLNALKIKTNQYVICNEMKNVKTVDIIYHYTHLMDKHDNDEHFEYIVTTLGECSSECNRFKRYGTEQKTSTEDVDINDIVYCQIMDKIHCYFLHSYDIGYRLTKQERELVNMEETKNESEYDEYNDILVNKKILLIRNLFQTKRKNSKQMNHRIRKFHQLENKENTPIYSFGYNFNYGFKAEFTHRSSIIVNESDSKQFEQSLLDNEYDA
eukprot:182562_1